MTAPVSACLIVKNDPRGLEQVLKSIRTHVAEICIVDTGSTDETPAVAQRYADKFEVYTGCNDPDGLIMDFSDARRRSFELATQPWALWVDSDDEVIGAENLAVLTKERVPKGRYPMFLFEYDYAQDDHGNSICTHWRERLVLNPSKFKWTSPIHEVLSPLEPENTYSVLSDKVKIKHHRQRLEKPQEDGRNLRIIRAYMKKHGDGDTRLCYYRGLEEANAGHYREALRWHRRYVERSGWDDERALACLEVAKIHQGFEEWELAIEWALKAISVRETWCEPYFSLGRSHYHLAKRGEHDATRNWERCANFIRQGLALPPTRSILWTDPTDRAHHIHEYLNVALHKLGDTGGALESCRTALAFMGNIELQVNAEVYEEELSRRAVDTGVAGLIRLGKLDPAAGKAATGIINGHYTMRRPRAGAKDVVFFLGRGLEAWNPETLAEKGMGGSETMAAGMAKRLAARGHRVRVYGDCADLEGTFDGVQYLDSSKFHNLGCDVLVSSRRPDAVDAAHGVTARRRVLWVHDVHCGDALTPERATAFDRILVLSEWHRGFVQQYYQWLDERKLCVTRNAVDLSRFEGTEERNPHRAIYSSSPDRGLLSLLQMWPRIRERVPDAELAIFYGFHNWRKAVKMRGSAEELAQIVTLEEMLESLKDQGVTMHGRVNGQQLAREFMKSGAWLYPTWFSETSCITAMEAQAAGCFIVTSPIAALTETVSERWGTMVPGDWLSPDYQAEFVQQAALALSSGQGWERAQLTEQAGQRFDFDSLVDAWERDVL